MKRAKGNGQYAKVTITLEPGERDSGVVFESQIKGGAIPKEFIPSVEKGIREAATSGPLGWPVVDFKAILTDGKFHEQDSSGYAFQIAGHRAAKGGFVPKTTTGEGDLEKVAELSELDEMMLSLSQFYDPVSLHKHHISEIYKLQREVATIKAKLVEIVDRLNLG